MTDYTKSRAVPDMELISFQLKNYKSFYDSGELRFGCGFNAIVGPNNVGKSALLQALAQRFTNVPHRSVRSKPTANSAVVPYSLARYSIKCNGAVLREALLEEGGKFSIHTPGTANVGKDTNYNAVIDVALAELFSREKIVLDLERDGNDAIKVVHPSALLSYPIRGENIRIDVKPVAYKNAFEFDGIRVGKQGYNPALELGAVIGRIFQRRIYYFNAERLSLGECEFGSSQDLDSSAANLAEVLNNMQSNPGQFERLNKYLKRVFPTIHGVSVRPSSNGNVLQIVVWSVPPSTGRIDLAISLSDSGTGVGQVLAMLYVAITSPTARTVIIDEPNSFLNPGAAKKLIEVLREFPNLQYIVSTHSPEILGVAHPCSLSLIRWNEGVSSVDKIEAKNIDSMHLVLREMGASLSDVYGADRLLWVEGPTEQVCFVRIIERLMKRPLAGTAIVAVQDVGRLSGLKKSADLVLDIYEKLSGMGAIIPPVLGFSFDREGRTQAKIDDIKRRSRNKFHFLPRRMIENYFIDEDAIAAVISTEMRKSITVEQVKKCIEAYREEYNSKFQSDSSADISASVYDGDGAALLTKVFEELSERTVMYHKVQHGALLTDWLIDNKPTLLSGLAEYIDRLLSGS
jgi:energy-coupling factor transporter ATP-binding protein EcfA2